MEESVFAVARSLSLRVLDRLGEGVAPRVFATMNLMATRMDKVLQMVAMMMRAAIRGRQVGRPF